MGNSCEQTQSIFFRLPREMRDEIYHNLLLIDTHVYLPRGSFPSFFDAQFIADYNDAEPWKTDPLSPFCDFGIRYGSRHPKQYPKERADGAKWLLTCQVILREGQAQFLRKAEWYWGGIYSGASYNGGGHWKTQLDLSKVTRLELYVGNFSNYHTPSHYEGEDSRKELPKIAYAMRAAQPSMEKIRCVGHSYWLSSPQSEANCRGQVGHMMFNLKRVFEGVQVKKWELGVVHPRIEGFYTLFEDMQGDLKDTGTCELKVLDDHRVIGPKDREEIAKIDALRKESMDAGTKRRQRRRNIED